MHNILSSETKKNTVWKKAEENRFPTGTSDSTEFLLSAFSWNFRISCYGSAGIEQPGREGNEKNRPKVTKS